MFLKPTTIPVLQEGMAYTIILNDGRKVRDAIYYACIVSGKPYLAKGNDIYPVEEVRSHFLLGHNAPDDFQEDGTPDPDRLAITDKVCEVIDVVTTPNAYSEAFRRRIRSLMNSGPPQFEAKMFVASILLKLDSSTTLT